MYHSITIGQLTTVNISDDEQNPILVNRIVGKNTWDDWHLIPAIRPYAALPEPNANAVEIPFRDGTVDLSEAVTGYVTYKDRSGSWDFFVVNDYHDWVALKKAITNYLHGRKMCVWFEDDPSYYYEGRLSISDYKPGANNSMITISYNLSPYKLALESSGDDWLWDPFNFEDGYISTAKAVTSPCTVTIIGGRMRSYPTITASASGMTVSLNGASAINLDQGENVMTNMILPEGENTLAFTGNGTITVSYREGSL